MWEVKRIVQVCDNGRQARVTIPREVVECMGWSGRSTDVQLTARSGRIELRVIP
jgi:hypothetical protein